MGRGHALPAVVATAMLLGALAPHDYGYFVALRWVVTIAAIIVVRAGVKARSALAPLVPLPFVLVALLFNPLLPVTMERSEWVPVDLLAALLFLVAGLAILEPTSSAVAEAAKSPVPVLRSPPPSPSPAQREVVQPAGQARESAPQVAASAPEPQSAPRAAAPPKNPEAELAKALELLYDTTSPQPDEGRALLERIAEANSGPVRADALCELGISLLEEDYDRDDDGSGWGYYGDLDAAHARLEEAAQAGSTRAMLYLAELMLHYANPPEPSTARALLERAATEGNTQAMQDLAALLTLWDPPDHRGAEEWLGKAAGTGDAWAMLELSRVIEENDPARALDAEKWLRRAASAGLALACWGLAERLARDPEDWAEAKIWMQRAAADGEEGPARMLADGFPVTFQPDEPW